MTSTRLQTYYNSLESRLGYSLLLGGTRHFGYWEHDTYCPFPISASLRRMEKHLYESLDIQDGEVLDAGCGDGHVAIYMSKMGLKVRCIDLMETHLRNARENLRAEGLDVCVEKGDYHHLKNRTQSLDGIYTMETLVHAIDPKQALTEFFRVLRPGGKLALYEYDHLVNLPEPFNLSMATINQYAAMPANQLFQRGVLESLLREVGFEEIVLKDLTPNIKPMLRMFYYLAFVPYQFVILFGMQMWFINVIAGVQGCRGDGMWRYVAITARKPQVKRSHSAS